MKKLLTIILTFAITATIAQARNRLDKKRNAKTNMGALQESLPSRTF